MIRFGAVVALLGCAIAADAENLIRNGDFENVTADVPQSWTVFIEDHAGAVIAEGRTDNAVAYSGSASARLDNPRAYPKEPFNCWIQHVERNVAGKTMRLTGVIKTAGSARGVILVQSGVKRPFSYIQYDSTATDQPVEGDTDWTQVSMDVEVPSEAEFVTIRCGMEGVGTVWFDSIALNEIVAEPTPPSPALAERTPEPNVDEMENEPEPLISPSAVADAPTVEEMVAANEALRETVRDLSDRNAELIGELRYNQREISALQQELTSLRSQINELMQLIRAQSNPPAQQPPAPRRVPPLIPGNDPSRVPLP